VVSRSARAGHDEAMESEENGEEPEPLLPPERREPHPDPPPDEPGIVRPEEVPDPAEEPPGLHPDPDPEEL
jgi:hypothetical protein